MVVQDHKCRDIVTEILEVKITIEFNRVISMGHNLHLSSLHSIIIKLILLLDGDLDRLLLFIEHVMLLVFNVLVMLPVNAIVVILHRLLSIGLVVLHAINHA